jgi:signal transduction histidine kinase
VQRVIGHAGGMLPTSSARAPARARGQVPAPGRAPARGRALAWVPHGAQLSEQDWRWRHTAVSLVLAVHLPVLAAWALLSQRSELWHVLLPLVPLLVAVRLPGLSRSVRSLAGTLGLLTCSALVVHLSPEATEAHFHFFVTVALIALYQDWALYALAIAFVLAHHGALIALGTNGDHGWLWALVHVAFVGAESAVLVLFWRAHELSREAEERARSAAERARTAAEQARVELAEGEDALQARIAAADQIRSDLIGTVSHEFRTPLTGIRAAALTLRKRGDRLDKDNRDRMLAAILDQQERLSRLLENMLLAATATEVDPAACAAVDAVAAEVAMLAARRRGDSTPVSVLVEPGLTARIDRTALHQVLANLVDNALQHGAPGSTPLVAGGHDDAGVWVTVSNEGRVLDLTRKGQLFQPFTQVSTGATRDREGIGVGLYVVRRLVEVYGGSVDVQSDSGWVTVEIRLGPAAVLPLAPPVPVG